MRKLTDAALVAAVLWAVSVRLPAAAQPGPGASARAAERKAARPEKKKQPARPEKKKEPTRPGGPEPARPVSGARARPDGAKAAGPATASDPGGARMAADRTAGRPAGQKGPRGPRRADRVGPFKIRSRDGRSSIEIRMAVQLRMEFSSSDVDPKQKADNDVQFLARRIRPAMTGTLFTPKLRFLLHLSTAPGSLEFMDFYFDYHLGRHVQFRAGQWKIPFTRYRSGSFRNLTLVEWSILSPFFGAERQMGLMAQNLRDPAHRFVYAFGAFTGVNARASHALGISRIYGETPSNPSDLRKLEPADTVHPELVLHLAYRHGRIDTRTDTDWMGTGVRFYPAVSVAWDLRPDLYQDFALRLCAEFLVKVRGWSFFAMAFAGFAPWGDSHLEQKFASIGGLAQSSVLLRRRFELSARYAAFQTGRDIRDAARNRADLIISAEPDPAARAALAEQYVNAGRARLEQEATVGFNWYLIGPSLKWQTDISWLGHSYTDSTRHDIRVRTQLQLSF